MKRKRFLLRAAVCMVVILIITSFVFTAVIASKAFARGVVKGASENGQIS